MSSHCPPGRFRFASECFTPRYNVEPPCSVITRFEFTWTGVYGFIAQRLDSSSRDSSLLGGHFELRGAFQEHRGSCAFSERLSVKTFRALLFAISVVSSLLCAGVIGLFLFAFETEIPRFRSHFYSPSAPSLTKQTQIVYMCMECMFLKCVFKFCKLGIGRESRDYIGEGSYLPFFSTRRNTMRSEREIQFAVAICGLRNRSPRPSKLFFIFQNSGHIPEQKYHRFSVLITSIRSLKLNRMHRRLRKN